MGTRKKFVLAGLVSMTVVLSVVAGMWPAQQAETTNAASDGRVDMATLLGLIMGPDQAGDIVLSSPQNLDGVVVKTPIDNAQVPEIPVAVQATVPDAQPADEVTFAAYEAGETPSPWDAGAQTWTGNVFSTPAQAPFIDALDISPFVTGTANVQSTIYMYGLLNAAEQTKATTLVYEAASAPEDALELFLLEAEATVDDDDNGFPDNPFDPVNGVGPGEVWISRMLIDGMMRTVMIANLDRGSSKQLGDVYVSPSGNVTVRSPALADLIGVGAIADPAADGLLVVEVVDELAALLDEVDGQATASARQAWADARMAEAPGPMTQMMMGLPNLVEISIVYSSDGGATFDEAGSLEGTGLNVSLTLEGLQLEPNELPQLWSHPTAVLANASGLTNVPGATGWDFVAAPTAAEVAAGTIQADLTDLSVYAPFSTGIELLDVDPPQIPEGTAIDMTLTGVLPIATALSLSEAQAAYTVYIGGVEADFRAAKQAVAITEPDANNESSIYVTSPVLAEGDVDVELADNSNPANASILPAAVMVSATGTVDTDFDEIDGETLNPADVVISLNPTSGSSGSLTLAAGTYFEGDALTASFSSPNPDISLVRWELNGTDIGSTNPVSLPGGVPAGANDLVAVVDLAVVGPTTYELVIQQPAEGGSITDVSGTYNENAVVNIDATADSGYEFVAWTGDTDSIADVNAASTTITMDSDKTISADFEEEAELSITGITPNEAWIFGGVVAEITGTGLMDGIEVTIGGKTVYGFRAAADGTSVEVIIPPTDDTSDAATVLADVAVDDGADTDTLPNGLTYKRHQTDAQGVNSTAFILDAPEADSTVDVTLGVPGSDFAQLLLPGLTAVPDGVDMVYGVARNQQVSLVKQNTEPIGALGTGAIANAQATEGVPTGDEVGGSFDFSVHLYASMEVAKNTPPAGSGSLSTASGLIDFEPAVDEDGNPVTDPDGNPVETAMRLTIPANAAFDYGDVRDGLMIWGVGTEFDYVTETTTLAVPEEVDYQSELLVDEVSPEITDGETPGNEEQPDLIQEARMYSLNGFSLRKNALLPESVTSLVSLSTDSGTAQGDVAGGTGLTVVSPRGGLAWVEKVELAQVDGDFTVSTSNLDTTPGTTEWQLAFKTPESDDAGICDLLIYLKSDPSQPAVTLERVFEYTREPRPLDSLLLILLGVLVAIIGLLAGGDSGGGGGGPCFIATAAYGTPMAEDIDTLRAVRDTFMLDNAAGTALVDTYYRVSPAIADVVAQSPVLAALVRVLLVPVIFLGKVALAMPHLTALAGLSLGAAYMLRRRRRSRA